MIRGTYSKRHLCSFFSHSGYDGLPIGIDGFHGGGVGRNVAKILETIATGSNSGSERFVLFGRKATVFWGYVTFCPFIPDFGGSI